MSDVPTATKIAALEEQVRQLTAAVTRECDRRIEETERLRCELDGQEATRKFRAAELHAVRLALAERNAYAERLLAENVRLSNEAAFMRGFINNEDVRSDFQTVTAMRQALDRERERCGVLEREVRAERDMKQKAFTCDWCGTRCNESSCGYCVALRELEAARKATDTRHALDAAKFGA